MARTINPRLFALIPIALAMLACTAHAAVPGPWFLMQLELYSPVTWIPVCVVAVLAIILVAGVVYSLSGIIGSTNAKNWSRVQIFEALLSLILIIAFGAFSSLLFLNPQAAFRAFNLMPGWPLAQGAASNPSTDCTGATSIYSLAACDLSMFNSASFDLSNTWYVLSYVTGLLPNIAVTITPYPLSPGISINMPAANAIPLLDIPLLGFVYVATLTIILVQQLQLLLIVAAPLFLSVFITLGLVARTFGFTRTFGGAMIAFGLGIGLIYPLMVCMTYGYVNVQGHVSCMLISAYVQPKPPSCIGTGTNTYSTEALFSAFLALLLTSTGITSQLTTVIAPIFQMLGYLLAGLTFIPFMNFIIVDAFIVDFSQAIGERMNFMGLLAGIV
jgi:hypothetical protein